MKDNKIVNIAGLLLITALAFFIVFQVKDYVDSAANAIDGVSKDAVEEAMDVTGQEIVKSAVKYVKDGVAEAFVVTVAPEGFHGPIEMEVTFGADGLTVKSVNILSQTETENFGSKIQDADILAKFEGAVSPLGDDLDLISGATITSEAAKYGVNVASAFIQQAEFGVTVEVEEPDVSAGATH